MAASNVQVQPQMASRSRLNIALWIVQGLLGALFIFAGGMKLVTPIEEMTKQMPMPGAFLRFIGVVELLGGIGLLAPRLTGILPWLTPLAAAGLVLVMIGAVVVSIEAVGALGALFPLITGLLAAFVAYGRWKVVP